MSDNPASIVDFGFRSVNAAEKAGLVRAVFDRVAPRYDLMNDLMSLGIHRLWKRILISDLQPRPGLTLLDLAGGTGDVSLVVADAEKLPLPDRCVDRVSMAFGLRNCTDKPAVLREVRRVLRPGGRFLCLEFSRVTVYALRPVYDAWSFKVLPRLGRMIAGDADSYRYLVESIRTFPHQEKLTAMIREAGLARVKVRNLSSGIAAIHSGWRL